MKHETHEGIRAACDKASRGLRAANMVFSVTAVVLSAAALILHVISSLWR